MTRDRGTMQGNQCYATHEVDVAGGWNLRGQNSLRQLIWLAIASGLNTPPCGI